MEPWANVFVLTGTGIPGQSAHTARINARDRRKTAPERLEVVIAELAFGREVSVGRLRSYKRSLFKRSGGNFEALSLFIVQLSLWNTVAPAMTNEQ